APGEPGFTCTRRSAVRHPDGPAALAAGATAAPSAPAQSTAVADSTATRNRRFPVDDTLIASSRCLVAPAGRWAGSRFPDPGRSAHGTTLGARCGPDVAPLTGPRHMMCR